MSFTSQYQSAPPAKMELLHADGSASGVFLSIIGQDSKAFRDVAKKLMKARLAKKTDDLDIEQAEKDNAELAAACIVGWDEDFDSQPYSPARALELMKTPELSLVREQVESFVRVRTNFFRRAEKSVDSTTGTPG